MLFARGSLHINQRHMPKITPMKARKTTKILHDKKSGISEFQHQNAIFEAFFLVVYAFRALEIFLHKFD